MSEATSRKCAHCGADISHKKRSVAKYCTMKCQIRAWKATPKARAYSIPYRVNYRAAHKDKISAYLTANKERISARRAAYNAANKERIAAYNAAIRERKNAWQSTSRARHRATSNFLQLAALGSAVIQHQQKEQHEIRS